MEETAAHGFRHQEGMDAENSCLQATFELCVMNLLLTGAFWQWAKSFFCAFLPSGCVLVLCPRAQSGDRETRHTRERRGRYRHRCNLRDSGCCCCFSLVLWLRLSWPCTTNTAQLFPSWFSPPLPLPSIHSIHPSGFTAWYSIIALHLLQNNCIILLWVY